MATILITGGAGYIGSHALRALAAAGHELVVLDDLVFGHRGALPPEGVDFYQGKVDDRVLLERLFSHYAIEAVMHFAAWAYVGESVQKPLKYYQNNLAAPLVLLDVMRQSGCKHLVFSSTCASYGNPVRVPMDEDHRQEPINPYGKSKWMFEQVLADLAAVEDFSYVALRYFNACGAAHDARIGEDHDPETHLIPLALMAARDGEPELTIYGDDYPTPDGTCLRDYIHVEDLASAHAAALGYLLEGGKACALNLGTEVAVSVKEILALIERTTGKPVPTRIGPRRPGDPPELVADASKARELLGWQPRWSVADAIEHAWAWMSAEHGGRYED